MRLALACFLAALATPAHSAWEVERHKDRMTDKTIASARLASLHAALVVTCGSGPTLTFERPIALRRLGVNYRFDSDAVVPRIADMASDGRTVHLWLGNESEATRRIARGKRLRVEVFPPAAERVFIEFDLTGAGEAIRGLGCAAGR